MVPGWDEEVGLVALVHHICHMSCGSSVSQRICNLGPCTIVSIDGTGGRGPSRLKSKAFEK